MLKKEKKRIQDDITDNIVKPHGRVLLAPRFGKTRVAIKIIKKFKPLNILWVTPSRQLIDEDIPNEFIKWTAKRFLKKTTLSTYMGLHNIKGNYDLIIFDEEQHITENNIEPVLNGQITYNNIISMTGTETEHEIKKEIYAKLNLKVLYKHDIKSSVDVGMLADYQINVVNVDMLDQCKIHYKNKTTRTEKDHYKMTNTLLIHSMRSNTNVKFAILNRRNAIINSPSKEYITKKLLSVLKGRKIIFAGSIKNAENLSEYCFHSKTDDTNLIKFQNEEIDQICMVNSGGTGFTYKKIDHLIMVQTDSDKNGLSSQKISRTLLEQKNYKANVWLICLRGTQDEKWIKSTLARFHQDKIVYIDYRNILNGRI